MTDIVERLRAHMSDDHVKGCDGRCYVCDCGYDKRGEALLCEAADEIKRLRAEASEEGMSELADTKRIYALELEIERLRAERDDWKGVVDDHVAEIDRLRAENADLQAANQMAGKQGDEIERLQIILNECLVEKTGRD